MFSKFWSIWLMLKKGINISEKINEPIDPEIVLLGLIFVSFLPLNILPKTSPPMSDSIATKTEYKR
jgi:hypothetical protein